jgi:hypothetical protein
MITTAHAEEILTSTNNQAPVKFTSTNISVPLRFIIEKLLNEFLSLVGVETITEFIYVRSPKEAQKVMNEKEGTEGILYHSHAWSSGNMEAFDIAYYYDPNSDENPILDCLWKIGRYTGIWFLGKDYIVVCQKPVTVTLGDFIPVEDSDKEVTEDNEGTHVFSNWSFQFEDGFTANAEFASREPKKFSPLRKDTAYGIIMKEVTTEAHKMRYSPERKRPELSKTESERQRKFVYLKNEIFHSL